MVSKAFTREDANASFQAPEPLARRSERRLTAYGARLARDRLSELTRTGAGNDGARAVERLRDLLEGATVVDAARADRAALGARVTVRAENGDDRTVVIVTPGEVGLVPAAISAASTPLLSSPPPSPFPSPYQSNHFLLL